LFSKNPASHKYDVPKAYRPIALLNTLAKLLTAIITKQLIFYAEKHNLLPSNHFRERARRSATNAVHLLVYQIKGVWQKGRVVLVLFLDIEGAFPNADNNQLVYNLRARKVPKKIITFVANMLKDRSTTLYFDNHISNPIELNNDIGQGDPLSMALYQFYNTDLVEITNTEKGEFAAAYVDDAIISALADSFEEAHAILIDMMTRKGIAICWAK
jgi:Reverse transcriptase (RNA-dependent DNA polymerase)